MKKNLLAWLPVGMLMAAAIAIAQASYPINITLTAQAPSGQVQPGSIVSIPINISSTSLPAGVQFSATIPPEISSLSAQAGSAAAAAGKGISCATTSGVMTCIIFSGTNATAIANGVLANLTATVAPSTGSTATTINFTNALGVSPAGDGQGVAPVTGASFQIAQNSSLTITSLSCTPTSLSSNATATCTVTLSGAPVSPLTVTLSSSNQTLSVPLSLNLTTQTGTFTATAGTVTTSGSATVTAAFNGSTQTFAIALTPPTLSKCDLNGDGVTDSKDVTISLNQVNGSVACTNADLNGDGKCTVVDLQNLVNAAQGQACRTAF